mgnify:CR=1 FL=1
MANVPSGAFQTLSQFYKNLPYVPLQTIVNVTKHIVDSFFPEFEKWKVKNLDRFYGSKVTIYDRFGKMLREYDVDQFNGWDGTYLGSPMPSTDYWYVISIQELDKELVGHFTLRRRNK